jgi:hypothetical protein
LTGEYDWLTTPEMSAATAKKIKSSMFKSMPGSPLHYSARRFWINSIASKRCGTNLVRFSVAGKCPRLETDQSMHGAQTMTLELGS